MSRFAPVLVGLLALYAPAALACPVCGGGGQNQQAFIDTMIFMSALPLMMLAGISYLVYRLAKAEAAANAVDATTTSPAEPQR